MSNATGRKAHEKVKSDTEILRQELAKDARRRKMTMDLNPSQVKEVHEVQVRAERYVLKIQSERDKVDELDAQAALACLGQPAADPSTDKQFFDHVIHTGASADALAAWQLHGVAYEALGRYPEVRTFTRTQLQPKPQPKP